MFVQNLNWKGVRKMRMAFISDIHGNANALDAVLEDVKNRQVEKVYCLGDIAYRGPEPQRSVDLIDHWIRLSSKEMQMNGLFVAFNRGVPDGALPMMRAEQEWICSHMTQDSIHYLRDLPTELKLEAEGVLIHAFHATPESLFEVVLPHESDELLNTKMMGKGADLYVYAHIHRPYIRYIDGKCIMNIGSVGLPFDGLAKASYALVDIHKGTFQNLDHSCRL